MSFPERLDAVLRSTKVEYKPLLGIDLFSQSVPRKIGSVCMLHLFHPKILLSVFCDR